MDKVPTSPSLTLVIPTYNEAARLAEGLDRLRHAAGSGAVDLSTTELLIVDDGSTDDTRATAERLVASFARGAVIAQPRNLGKGAAVRAGVLAATGDRVVFADADMAIDPRHLAELCDALGRVPIAVGSRAISGRIDYGSRFRTGAGRVFNLAVRAVGGVHLTDTQCGFKGFRRGEALLLAHLQTTRGYAFDVELLWLAGRLGIEVGVVPVTWLDVPGSTVRVVRDSTRMLVDLVQSRRRARWIAATDLDGDAAGPLPRSAVVLSGANQRLLCGSASDVGAVRRAGTSGRVRLLSLEDLAALAPFELHPAA